MDEAILEFRRTRLTKENIWPNVGYLYSKVQIGHIGEYFEPAHNYICSKVWIGRIGEYLEPIRNH